MMKQKICVFEQNMVRHFTVATMSQLPMQQYNVDTTLLYGMRFFSSTDYVTYK